MSFQAPNSRQGQESQNRKILEELQQQKKYLITSKSIANSATTGPISGTPSGMSNPILTSPQNQTGGLDNHSLVQSQRTALQHANSNSTGFFITQESSFGNLILPVIPQFNNPA